MSITSDPSGIVPQVSLAPSPYHIWNWTTRTFEPDLPAAKAARRGEVDVIRDTRTYLPIAFDGASFDADPISRERIIATTLRLVRGDGIPAGWVGWRDADNEMRWTMTTPEILLLKLRGLSTTIENREQDLLIGAWVRKATIDAMTSVEAVVAYDINAGW